VEDNRSSALQQARTSVEKAGSALQPAADGARLYNRGLDTVEQTQNSIGSDISEGRHKLGEAEAALQFVVKNTAKITSILGGYPQDEIGDIAGPLRTISTLADNVQSANVAPAQEALDHQAAASAALDEVKSALQNAPNISQGSAEVIGRAAIAIGQEIRE